VTQTRNKKKEGWHRREIRRGKDGTDERYEEERVAQTRNKKKEGWHRREIRRGQGYSDEK
jgi:hypothetical protein